MEMDYNLTDFGSYVSCDGYKKLRNDEPIDGASCICVESCLSFPFVTTSLITAKLKSWITSVSRVLLGPLSRHTHVGRETRSHQHVLKLYENCVKRAQEMSIMLGLSILHWNVIILVIIYFTKNTAISPTVQSSHEEPHQDEWAPFPWIHFFVELERENEFSRHHARYDITMA